MRSTRDHLPPSARGLMALGIALLFCGLLTCMSALMYSRPAVAAQPATPATKVVGGHLDWAFTKALDQEGAQRPSLTASGGATVSPDGTLHFPATGGTYDPGNGAATVTYRGTVVLAYPGSTVTVADPTVLMGTSDSTLQATVNVVTAGVAPHASPASPVQAAIGDLKTYGIAPQTAQQTMTWTQVPATLTATGAEAFPGAVEGGVMGPVTWAVTLQNPAAATTGHVSAAATTPSTTPDPTESPTACETPTTTPTVTPTVTPTPTDTDCATPEPTDSATTDTPSNSSDSGSNENLPKTGGKLAPLMALGAMMTAGGGGTMLIARRKGFTFHG